MNSWPHRRESGVYLVLYIPIPQKVKKVNFSLKEFTFLATYMRVHFFYFFLKKSLLFFYFSDYKMYNDVQI